MVSEQTRQLVTETLQQVTRSAEVSQGQTSGPDGSKRDETSSLTEAGGLTGEASQSSTQGTLSSKNLFLTMTVLLVLGPHRCLNIGSSFKISVWFLFTGCSSERDN